jgi:hypothetical protein
MLQRRVAIEIKGPVGSVFLLYLPQKFFEQRGLGEKRIYHVVGGSRGEGDETWRRAAVCSPAEAMVRAGERSPFPCPMLQLASAVGEDYSTLISWLASAGRLGIWNGYK